MSLPTPNTRKEQYLNAIATGNTVDMPAKPITREEAYLDAIAKNGGGSGDGDMKKSVYDSDLDVAGAGGIKAFVNDAISGKVDKEAGKGLSTNDYSDTEKGKVADSAEAIEAISDMLTPSQSVQLTLNSNVVSSGAGMYTKIGRLVFVTAEFTPSSVANEGVIATGLPKVLNENCSVWDGFAQTKLRNTSGDDAQWCFWFPTHTGLDRRQISFMYISQN